MTIQPLDDHDDHDDAEVYYLPTRTPQPIDDEETVAVDKPVTPGRPVDPPDPPRRPVYASVTGRRELHPIVPAALRNADQRRALARWYTRYATNRAVYHVTRSPKYAAKTAFWAPVGLVRGSYRVAHWGASKEHHWELRHQAVRKADYAAFLAVDRNRQKSASWRWWIVGAGVMALAAAVLAVVALAPVWVAWVALAASMPVLARVGRPQDKPIIDRVHAATAYRKLTAELVRAGLLATGYGKLPADFAFPREIIRDGPGYSALVDLPHGVTDGMVMDRRDRIAGALRLPLDQVWLRPGRHAGQVELWVADEPISTTPQAPWPLLRKGVADIFAPVPLGTNERGERVAVLLMFTNLVIGAIPRMGKTFVLRLVLLAAALDPRVELWAADLKGTGDLGPLEPVARRYFVGDDDDELDALLAALRALGNELRRRAQVIRNLPRDLAPESKVTPELAANKALGLHPIVVGIDECQVAFTDEQRGKEFERLCTDLIKRGPAMGIMLVLATQRPDAKSLPTGISGNAGMRLCLRVMGQQENDMVLGTSMYRNGIRATQFTAADKGMGWLVGALDEPVIVRTHYVDAPMAEKVVQRALQARGGRVEEDDRDTVKATAYDLLDDVRAVWVIGEEALWSELLVPRLQALRPDVYGDLTVEMFGARMAAAGVPTVKLGRRVDGRATTRAGVRLDALDARIGARKLRPADSPHAAIDSPSASPRNVP